MSRARRNRDFEIFRLSFSETFQNFLIKDTRAQELKNSYSLLILNHSPDSILDRTRVIAYFGNRIYETIVRNRTQNNLEEEGAIFNIEKRDDGFVTVKLFPAKAVNYQQKEDFIVLEKKLDPKHLCNPFVIKKYWYFLIAYMEVTSLDGAPSLLQNLVVIYLRSFKPLIIRKKYNYSKIQTFLLTIFKFILTVGLSGFLILIINNILSKKQEDEIRLFRSDFDEKINSTSREFQNLKRTQGLYFEELKQIMDSTTNAFSQKFDKKLKNDSILIDGIKRIKKNAENNILKNSSQ